MSVSNQQPGFINNEKGVALVQTLALGAAMIIGFLTFSKVTIQQAKLEAGLLRSATKKNFEDVLLYKLSREQTCACFFNGVDFSNADDKDLDPTTFFDKNQCAGVTGSPLNSNTLNNMAGYSGLSSVSLSGLSRPGGTGVLVGQLFLNYGEGSGAVVQPSRFDIRVELDPTTNALSSCAVTLTTGGSTEEVQGTFEHRIHGDSVDPFYREGGCDVPFTIQTGNATVPSDLPTGIPFDPKSGTVVNNGDGTWTYESLPGAFPVGSSPDRGNIPPTIGGSLSAKMRDFYVSADEYFANKDAYHLIHSEYGKDIVYDKSGSFFSPGNPNKLSELFEHQPMINNGGSVYVAALRKSGSQLRTIQSNQPIEPDQIGAILTYADFKDAKILDATPFPDQAATVKITWECRAGYWQGQADKSVRSRTCNTGRWYNDSNITRSYKGGPC